MISRLHDEIAAILHRHMDSGTISGGVVLIRREGEIVDLQAEGHADMDPAFRLEADSVFGVMSMTKPFVAACAMSLVVEGAISLDDPVSKYIPEFAAPRQVRTLKPGEKYPPFPPQPGVEPVEPEYDYAPADREISVRHILNFTSGLQTIGIPNGAPMPGPEDSLATFVPRLRHTPLEFQPGTQWHYSNATGYDVLGRVIEVASGQSLQDFARTHLFEPLDMTQSGFGIDPARKERVVPLGFLADTPLGRPDYPSGSGGLFSTASDYSNFAEMLRCGGMYRGVQVVPREAVDAMHRPQIGDLPFAGIRSVEYAIPIHDRRSAFTYGFGLGILERPSAQESVPIGSYGWDGIGSRRFWVMPSLKTVLIMLMPGVGGAADPAHQAIEAAVSRWAETAA